MVYPYAYNPVTKTLRVYTDLRIAVKKVSDNGENQKVARRSNTVAIDKEMKASYERRFINFKNETAKYDFLVDEGEMLIVCVDQYMEALQELVDWKNISGRPTTMVAASETGTTDALKTYVKNYYEENPNFVYLLLVGEHNNLPGYSTNGGRSDNYYGMLEGNDYYEEIFVGRLSVNSAVDAAHQVSKIIHYERDIDETATWITRAVGIGANEGAGGGHYGEADYVHMDFIRDTLLNYNYTEMSQHYAYINNPTASNMMADFNQGAGVANYANHGNPDGWAVGDFSNSHVHQLTNDNKLPFIWSVACNNGEFQYDECFAEAWMRAKNNSTNAPTGAIGGMFSWISQPWQPPMYGQDEMVAILAEWRDDYKYTLGGTSVNGNQYVLDMAPGDYGDTHNTWILFGDPSLMLRTDVPQSMNVVAPSTLVIGMSSMTVQASADYGIATLSRNNEVVATAKIVNGTAELEFPELTNVGQYKLVVIGYNKVTEVINVEVVPADGAFVIFKSFELNQEDGQVDYNENIELTMSVENVGTDPANNVTVEISTESEYVTINKATATIPTIGGNETITLDKAFELFVAPSVPNQTKISFEVKCSDATDTWVTEFVLTANAPVLALKSVGCDGTALPGETVALSMTFENVGNSAAYNIITELWENAPYITIAENVIETAGAAVGESFTVTTDVAVDASVEIGSVYEIAFAASAGYNTCSSKYAISVGSVTEDFETGDFSAYDWQLTSDVNWFIDDANAYEGQYCVRSGAIGDSQVTKLKLQVEVLAAGKLKFYKKVSTEETYDVASFLIDNVVKEEWSGIKDWSLSEIEITQGTHIIEWKFQKDYSVGDGSDCVWVDFISFPAVKYVDVIDGVENLTAELNSNVVTLSWDALSGADEYIIRRNGENVSTQAETTFTETVGEGMFTYNVVARNGNKYSSPVFVTVVNAVVDVIEVETMKVTVYPNPTSGVLNVEAGENFQATVYNYQGQVVMRNNISNGQIDMSELSSGVYFVEIRTNNNVSVEKVIVK